MPHNWSMSLATTLDILAAPGDGQLFAVSYPLDAAEASAARHLLGVDDPAAPVVCVDRLLPQPDHGPAPKGGGGVRLLCGDASRDYPDLQALHRELAVA